MSNSGRRRRAEDTRKILATRFPLCFAPQGTTVPKRPLAIGIYRQILARCPDLSAAQVKEALSDYTTGVKYAEASQVGAKRVDLDGNDVGEVAVSQANVAAARALARDQLEQLERRIKELEAAAQPLWACHVRGPHDMIPTADYESAVGVSDTINRNDPSGASRAVPAIWSGTADEHAIATRAGSEEYAWAETGKPVFARAA